MATRKLIIFTVARFAKFAYMTEIDYYIEQIRRYNADLANALVRLALDFEYDNIVTLIQKTKQ